MMVAVLLGALTLGACVDDNESASVTNVRNAKAEQLKAAAELDKAKAEAELIRANAEKAYREAEAEYRKTQTEAAQLANEEQKLLLEKAKEMYALELEKARVEAQKELQRLKHEMDLNDKQYATDTYYKIQTAYNNYYSAIYNLNDLKGQLIDKKATIAKLEAGVISAEAVNKANILYKEQAIAENEAKLAVLKDDAYAGLDNSELKAKAEAKWKEFHLADVAFAENPASVALLATTEPLKKAYKALEEQDDLRSEVTGVLSYTYTHGSGKFYYVVPPYATDENENEVNETFGYSYAKNVRINESAKLYYDRQYADNVKEAADDLGTASDTKDKTTAYGVLAKANDDLKVANEALKTANALPDTDATKKDKIDAANQSIKDAETAIASAKDNLARYQKEYDEAVAAQKEYNEALAAFDVAAYNAAVAEFEAALEAQTEALDAWREAYSSIYELYYEARALEYLANTGADINQQIANLEKDIAEAKEDIEEYKFNNNDAVLTLEKAKAEIEYLEDKIEGQTRIVEAAKAALDAAIASSDEETPEE